MSLVNESKSVVTVVGGKLLPISIAMRYFYIDFSFSP